MRKHKAGATRLTSVKIATIWSSAYLHLPFSRTEYSASRMAHYLEESFLAAPPDTFDGLPIVQRGESYRLYDTDPRSGRGWVVTKIAWYSFGQGGEVGYWTSADVEREWPVPLDNQRLTGDLERVVTPQFGLTHMLSDLREKKGHEETVAWF
jgi:hypothetical protein